MLCVFIYYKPIQRAIWQQTIICSKTCSEMWHRDNWQIHPSSRHDSLFWLSLLEMKRTQATTICFLLFTHNTNTLPQLWTFSVYVICSASEKRAFLCCLLLTSPFFFSSPYMLGRLIIFFPSFSTSGKGLFLGLNTKTSAVEREFASVWSPHSARE